MVLADLSKNLTESIKRFGARNSAQAEAEVDTLLNEIESALIAGDVSVPYVEKLKKDVRKEILDERYLQQAYGVQGGFSKMGSQQKQKVIQRAVVTHLGKLLKGDGQAYVPKKRSEKRGGSGGSSLSNEPEVVLFVGLQGAGKTTSITKYAHYYKQKGFLVALVCADTFRAGAFDQLKQNASKIHTPFYGSYTETDPVVIAEDGVHTFMYDSREKFDLILVDSSGRHKQENALFDEMQQMVEAINPTASILVMDSRIGQAGFRQAEAFANAVDIGSVILTKMDDGSNKGGGALAAVAATGAPVVFLGTGEHFDQLDPFRAEGFVSKLMGMGDASVFMEAMQDSFIDKEALDRLADMEASGRSPTNADITGCMKGETKNLFDNISKGKFTLRNLYEMFNQIGPMGNMLTALPGFGGGAMPGMPQFDKAATQKKMQKCVTIMQSMTNAELDGIVEVRGDKSRIKRIAFGSGCKHEGEVTLLFDEFTRIEKMLEQMGGIDFSNPMATIQKMKGMLPKGAMQGMMGNMSGFVENMMSSMGYGKPPPGMVDQLMNSMMSDDPAEQKKMQEMMGGMEGNPMLQNMMGGMQGGLGLSGLQSGGSSSSSANDGNTILITGTGNGKDGVGGGGNGPAGGSSSGGASSGGATTPSTGSTVQSTVQMQKRVLKNNVPVVIQGLKSRPGENGKTGKILGYDEAKGRYTVGGVEGVTQPLSLKPANILQDNIDLLSGGGKLDWKSLLLGKGTKTNEPPVEGMITSLDSIKSANGEGSIRLKTKTTVRVQNLQSEKGKIWNDLYGVIMGYDEASERYVVNVGPTELKIKLANIML